MTTGFPPKVRQLIFDRAGGMCEGMVTEDCTSRVEHVHHRRPRGAGGGRRPEINRAANGLALCGDCHVFVESHRAYARDRGLLVPLNGSDLPSCVPVWRRGVLVLLDDWGGVHEQAVTF